MTTYYQTRYLQNTIEVRASAESTCFIEDNVKKRIIFLGVNNLLQPQLF